ncbi:hypothetical protein ACFP8W_11080, partial [Nocardioides hankookensis]
MIAEPMYRGCPVLDSVCDAAGDVVGDVVGGTAGGLAESAAESAIDKLAEAFGTAAGNTLAWLWKELDLATSVDLSDASVRQPMVFTGAFALVLLVALFVIQCAVSALRQDPGGLGRALKGLLLGTVGCAAALAITQLSLTAVDAMSKGVVQATTGQANAGALGKKLLVFQAVHGTNPIGLMLIAVIVMLAAVMVWASLMVRKVLILISVVFAAIAFAGGASDYTSSWVRKWVEVVVALVFSKFVIVVIMSLGYNMFAHAGTGSLDGASLLAAGVVVLLLAGLAPFMALKLVTFAGDGLHHHLRSASGGAAAAGRTITSAPQKAMSVSRMMSTSASSSRSTSGSASAGGAQSAARAQAPRPSPAPAMAGAGSAGGSA